MYVANVEEGSSLWDWTLHGITQLLQVSESNLYYFSIVSLLWLKLENSGTQANLIVSGGNSCTLYFEQMSLFFFLHD